LSIQKSELQPVDPVNPVAPWLGGKRNLAKRICARIDAIPHRTYVEPFVGMGGVFLRRSCRPRGEVINDRSRDVSTLFRILQRHYPQFIETLRFQITTRAEFNRLTQTDPETLTDLERAARFLYLQRLAYGGLQDEIQRLCPPGRGKFHQQGLHHTCEPGREPPGLIPWSKGRTRGRVLADKAYASKAPCAVANVMGSCVQPPVIDPRNRPLRAREQRGRQAISAYATVTRRPIVRAGQRTHSQLATVAIRQNLRGAANKITLNPPTPAIA